MVIILHNQAVVLKPKQVILYLLSTQEVVLQYYIESFKVFG